MKEELSKKNEKVKNVIFSAISEHPNTIVQLTTPAVEKKENEQIAPEKKKSTQTGVAKKVSGKKAKDLIEKQPRPTTASKSKNTQVQQATPTVEKKESEQIAPEEKKSTQTGAAKKVSGKKAKDLIEKQSRPTTASKSKNTEVQQTTPTVEKKENEQIAPEKKKSTQTGAAKKVSGKKAKDLIEKQPRPTTASKSKNTEVPQTTPTVEKKENEQIAPEKKKSTQTGAAKKVSGKKAKDLIEKQSSPTTASKSKNTEVQQATPTAEKKESEQIAPEEKKSTQTGAAKKVSGKKAKDLIEKQSSPTTASKSENTEVQQATPTVEKKESEQIAPEKKKSTQTGAAKKVSGKKAKDLIEKQQPLPPEKNSPPEITTTGNVSKQSNKELALEENLTEKEEGHHKDNSKKIIDYSTLCKEELVEMVKEITTHDDVVKADKVLVAVKPHFDKLRNAEREVAKVKFIAEGGQEEDFEFKYDELSNIFDANYKLIKSRKSKYFQEQEKEKDINLKKKRDLLKKIREFVDADETNISFEKFKAHQIEWKNIGTVPHAHNKTLWASYNALIDRFYDHRSIYFELKELDRKKNLQAKVELCVKAEKLADVEEFNKAIKTLNDLHEEFKHLGPVPKHEQEPLWQRFKTASDKMYAKRKGYVENLKVYQEENLAKKLELINLIQVYTEYNAEYIKEWNEKTKKVLEFQKQWKSIGRIPKERIKEVNKQFWNAFKTFFRNKNIFFKALDATREKNLHEKKILIEKAQELKESTDWIKTTDTLIKLQKTWKEIGPVSEKVRNSTYQQFKEACNYFFEQKRAQNQANESIYEANLIKKQSICEQIEALAKIGSKDIETLKKLQKSFHDIGFVPKKDIGTIKNLYSEAVNKFIDAIPDIKNEERQQIQMENELNKLINDPNAEEKIFRKEQTIKKQIAKIEKDASLWKNNIEFFASSKNADKVLDEFNKKIELARENTLHLKQQLKSLRSIK